MMPILINQIIKVIFVLSTIVAITDCCLSRFLLLREHTLNIVQHKHNHFHEHAHELQQHGLCQPVGAANTPGATTAGATTLPSVNEDKRKNAAEVLLLPCSEEYKANFRLNGGRCFYHPMDNSTVLHSCLGKDDYVRWRKVRVQELEWWLCLRTTD
ncbi:hypothetical protein KR026_006850 [Drosophila bipectinata]|nr:hypothetical protein KR026_006850 [Drosophila bipectinata]